MASKATKGKKGTQRKLTAILCADVVGYSRLMGADEEATIETLTAYRKVFTSKIKKHRGRVVDAKGDAILAEFASVVDAVNSAVVIQRKLAGQNAELSDGRRMDFRIGINMGDVVVKDDAIYGDGVNVAARLESLAEPGGICISRPVYDQVESKLNLECEYLGEQQVKNIAKPVRAYRINLTQKDDHDQVEQPEPVSAASLVPGGISLDLPDRPSIAVLPFANISGDPEQEYFSDGITEDLITNLSKILRLSVTARNTVFTYKDKAVNVKQVGKELDVAYVLEGSVRKAGKRVRITAQLIDAKSGNHKWAERYDRTLEDVFAVQDDITQNIVTALNIALLDGDQAMNFRDSTINPEVHYLFLRGRHAWQSDPNRVNLEEAERMWQRCVELDPGYARAYSGLAGNRNVRVAWLGEWDDQLLEEAEEYSRKAVALMENLAHGHTMLGLTLWYKREFDESLAAFKRALQHDPEGPQTLRTYAFIQIYNGKWSEAEKFIRKSISSTPSPTSYQVFVSGLAHLVRERNEEAIGALKGVAAKGSDFLALHLVLAAAYAAAERMPDANAQVGEILRIDPRYVTAERAPLMFRFRDSIHLDGVMKLLRKAGLE